MRSVAISRHAELDWFIEATLPGAGLGAGLYRWTTAARDLTVGGKRYLASAGAAGSVSPPAFDGDLSRSAFQLGLADPDGLWRRRFEALDGDGDFKNAGGRALLAVSLGAGPAPATLHRLATGSLTGWQWVRRRGWLVVDFAAGLPSITADGAVTASKRWQRDFAAADDSLDRIANIDDVVWGRADKRLRLEQGTVSLLGTPSTRLAAAKGGTSPYSYSFAGGAHLFFTPATRNLRKIAGTSGHVLATYTVTDNDGLTAAAKFDVIWDVA